MQINLEVCRTIAVQYGLPLQFAIKEFHVFNILGQIAAFSARLAAKDEQRLGVMENPLRHSGTVRRSRLVFKGGTALNKIYLPKGQRFSEDLDFDLEANGIQLTSFCRKLAENIYGYEINEFRKVGGTIQFYCRYETPLGGKDHVRVDLSNKLIISYCPPEGKQATSEFAHLSSAGILTYTLEDLTARKIHALGTRSEGKDVFDVYSALPLCGKLGPALDCMLRSERKPIKKSEFLENTIERLRSTEAKSLQRLTNPFIPLPYRPKDWRELKADLLVRLEALKNNME